MFSFITLFETCATKMWRDLHQCTDKTLILYIYIYRYIKYIKIQFAVSLIGNFLMATCPFISSLHPSPPPPHWHPRSLLNSQSVSLPISKDQKVKQVPVIFHPFVSTHNPCFVVSFTQSGNWFSVIFYFPFPFTIDFT